MEDVESAEEVVVHAEDFRAEYQRRLKSFCDRLRDECIKLELDYQQVRTDQPLDHALIAYLEKRMSL
jgi:hypothetical protein